MRRILDVPMSRLGLMRQPFPVEQRKLCARPWHQQLPWSTPPQSRACLAVGPADVLCDDSRGGPRSPRRMIRGDVGRAGHVDVGGLVCEPAAPAPRNAPIGRGRRTQHAQPAGPPHAWCGRPCRSPAWLRCSPELARGRGRKEIARRDVGFTRDRTAPSCSRRTRPRHSERRDQ